MSFQNENSNNNNNNNNSLLRAETKYAFIVARGLSKLTFALDMPICRLLLLCSFIRASPLGHTFSPL